MIAEQATAVGRSSGLRAGGQKSVAGPVGKAVPVIWETLLAGISTGKIVVSCLPEEQIFAQGQQADSVCFLLEG
jgi:hypothetical protein